MNKMEDIVVSAPGKVILHGEHAVVYGKKAIAASLDLRTFVHVKTTDKDSIAVTLPDIGLQEEWSTQKLIQELTLPSCDPLHPSPPNSDVLKRLIEFAGLKSGTMDTKQLAVVAFLYLYTSICYKNGSLPSLDVHLASTLPTSAGLGSSAAFSASLAASFLLSADYIQSNTTNSNTGGWKEADLVLINKWAFQAEKIIHGNPSGIDNSVSSYGGAIRFQSGKISLLTKVPVLRVLLFNTKVPRSTKLLVAGVRERYDKHPAIIGPILESMEAVSETCEELFSKMYENGSPDDYRTLQDLIAMNHSMLGVLGVSHPALEQICQTVSKHKLQCKLTGAGGGGCAFALLAPDFEKSSIQAVQNEIEALGFDCWETSIGGEGVRQHNTLDTCPTLPDSLQHLR